MRGYGVSKKDGSWGARGSAGSREKMREYKRAWNAAHRDRLRVYARAWRDRNRERVSKYRRDWGEQNRDRLRAYFAEPVHDTITRRRARKLRYLYGLSLQDFS